MKPRISLITLGVDDLERSVKFYAQGLGLKPDGIVSREFEFGAVAFFELESGLRLVLWPRQSLARDAGLPLGPPASTEFSLAHNVAPRAEVDAVMAQADAGARVMRPAQDTFWGGYAGCFLDPNQHLWEAAWNPQWFQDDQGSRMSRERGEQIVVGPHDGLPDELSGKVVQVKVDE